MTFFSCISFITIKDLSDSDVIIIQLFTNILHIDFSKARLQQGYKIIGTEFDGALTKADSDQGDMWHSFERRKLVGEALDRYFRELKIVVYLNAFAFESHLVIVELRPNCVKTLVVIN